MKKKPKVIQVTPPPSYPLRRAVDQAIQAELRGCGTFGMGRRLR